MNAIINTESDDTTRLFWTLALGMVMMTMGRMSAKPPNSAPHVRSNRARDHSAYDVEIPW